jgi:hypothetical protein
MPTRWGALGLAALLLAASAEGAGARPGEDPRDRSGLLADRLVRGLDASSSGGRPAAWTGLPALGEKAVPALVRGLSSRDRETREACAGLLAELGPCAAAAVPGIMARLHPGDEGWLAAIAAEFADPIACAVRVARECTGPGDVFLLPILGPGLAS